MKSQSQQHGTTNIDVLTPSLSVLKAKGFFLSRFNGDRSIFCIYSPVGCQTSGTRYIHRFSQTQPADRLVSLAFTWEFFQSGTSIMSEPSNLSVLSANNSASITSMSTPFNLPPSKFQIQDTLTEKANVTAITPTSCQQSFTVRHQRRDLNQPFELHVPSLPYPFVGSGVILHFNPSTTSNNVSGTLAPKNFRTGTQDTLDGLFASPPFIPFSDIAASLPHDVRLSHLSSASVPPNTYLTAAFRSEFLDHIDVPSEFQYRFDADLKTCSNKVRSSKSMFHFCATIAIISIEYN